MSNLKILVTGGLGYVGSATVEALVRDGCRVRIADNLHRGRLEGCLHLLAHPGVEFMRADVAVEDDVRRMLDGVDAVIHLAAIVGFPACAKAPYLSEAVNLRGTELLVRHTPPDVPLLFASTGSVYGKVEGTCTEESPLNPMSLYGIHKAQAERMVTARERGVAFRFATAFGANSVMRWDLLPNTLVRDAVVQRRLTVFQPEFRRTFIHVRDMAQAFVDALLGFNLLRHRVYNVGCEANNLTKRQLAEMAAGAAGLGADRIEYVAGGSDPDQRDYEVSYERCNSDIWRNGIWNVPLTVEHNLDQLVRFAEALRCN